MITLVSPNIQNVFLQFVLTVRTLSTTYPIMNTLDIVESEGGSQTIYVRIVYKLYGRSLAWLFTQQLTDESFFGCDNAGTFQRFYGDRWIGTHFIINARVKRLNNAQDHGHIFASRTGFRSHGVPSPTSHSCWQVRTWSQSLNLWASRNHYNGVDYR